MKSYFITGTDTGVGKTVVTAAIAACMKKRGIDVGVMKPVATGVPQKSGFKSSDASLLSEAATVGDLEDEINPVFIPLPISPYDACKILNVTFDQQIIFDRFETLRKKHKSLLVEGIGGIMTPLSKNYFVADMVKAMGLETIIVMRSTLGTLNHTMMTFKICKEYGIAVKGIIVNFYNEKGMLAERNTPATIHELTGVTILGVLPFVRDYQKLETMITLVEQKFDLKSIIS